MSQTENTETNSDERIRKIYVKDLKLGEGIHTVFRAARKEKHTSRGGKSFLALTLVDRTGEIDGRVFDNVDAADQAFSIDDYLLVKGKIGQFHGKSQVVIDRLERLDGGPIDAAEFAFTPAPVVAPVERPAQTPREAVTTDENGNPTPKVHLSHRLAKLLENPRVAQALDVLVAALEKTIEERMHAKAGLPPPPRTERPPRERKPRGPRVEHKPRNEASEGPSGRPEPRRDPSLPEGLAFKPFNALVSEPVPSLVEGPVPSLVEGPEQPQTKPAETTNS